MEGPPAAIVPVEKSFVSEMCAADLENFVHIRIYDKPNMKAYARIQYFLKRKHSSMLNKPLPEDEIKPGKFVVAEDNREYYRAKVLSKDNYGNINCYTVDDGTVCAVLPRQIFPINVTDLQAPAIVMKCRLEGLQLFNGLSYLQDAFTCIKIEENEEDPYFQTTVLGMEDGIPVVRLETKGRQLTHLVQQWIPMLCEKILAKTSSPVKATIVHAEEDGRIWFNTDDGNELLLRIEETLQKIDPNAKPKSKKDSKLTNKEVLDFWKREYCSLPNAVFITRSKDDGVYYRAKVTKPMTKEKSVIQFIDYGNKEVVCRDSLISAMDVDENLAFIPPQCYNAKLHGISWISDLDDFWTHVPQTVDLLVIEKQNPKDTPEVEIFQPGTTTSINHTYLVEAAPLAERRVKSSEQRDEQMEVSTEQIADLREPLTKQLDGHGVTSIEQLGEPLKIADLEKIIHKLKIPTHPSKPIECAKEEVQDSGMDTLTSTELIDLGEEDAKVEIHLKYEVLILQKRAKLFQMCDTFYKDVEAELDKIRIYEQCQQSLQQLRLGLSQECRMQRARLTEKFRHGSSGIGSDTEEDQLEPMDLRVRPRKGFVDLGFYKYGSSKWDFSDPISCPPVLPQMPENVTWDFVVTEQHVKGYFSLQSLENILGLKDLELEMSFFYDSVSRQECPSLHVVELKNNGYYAMYSNSMKRWIRIKLLQLPEEEVLVCLPICLIDYGRYEQLEPQEWMDVRPLKSTFLQLPMQGFTASDVAVEDVMKSEQNNPVDVKSIQRFDSDEGKSIRTHVFSCNQDRTATFPHLNLVVLEYIQHTY